jgi:hypothetical protein
MNKILIPLLFVIHYAVFVYILLLMTLDDSQFKVGVLYFTISSAVYVLSRFELGRAKLAVVFWYIFVAFNLLSYMNIFIRGVFFMIAAALVATLIARIVQNIYQRPSLPLPQAPLQRMALALWIAAVGLGAFSASSWTAWNVLDSLRFAIPGFVALLLTPAMRAVHKWLTPAQLALLVLLGVCHGLPDLTDFGIMDAITFAALCITAAAFCTLGWAYVRFLIERRRAA